MSDTPRTDNNIAFTDYMTCGEPLVYTYASFSRQLETELAEAQAEIERKDETIDACSRMLSARESLINKQSKLIEQMREALVAVQSDDMNGLSLSDKDKVTAALSAAERGE